ncbi:MAG TPA: hypothetical protein VF092_01610 [Longimicrobium sp.]
MPPHPTGSSGPPREPGWERVADRAAHDPEFRHALLTDPARALRETLGITLPAGYRVRFVERPRDLDALVVLPDPARDTDELSEDELEEAAGGDGTWSDDPPPPPPPPPPDPLKP